MSSCIEKREKLIQCIIIIQFTETIKVDEQEIKDQLELANKEAVA